MLGNFHDFFCLLLAFFKKSFKNTISLSKCLDPDQERHFVGPDLGLNSCKDYLQKTKVVASKIKVKEKHSFY